jgi:hypothetical protein
MPWRILLSLNGRGNEPNARIDAPNLRTTVIARAEGPWQSRRLTRRIIALQGEPPHGLPRRFAPRNDGVERGRSDGEERGCNGGTNRKREAAQTLVVARREA